MKLEFKKNLFSIQPYIPGKPIEEVKRELGLKEVIKLASNENPYGPSPEVLRALKREIPNLNRYPDGGCFHLRKALARRLNVDSKRIIFGNGSDEIICLAVRALVRPRDEVIVAQPSFLIYTLASRVEGAQVRTVPLKGFYYDLKKMAALVNSRTKIIFIGNPDNPAGTYVTESQVREFLKLVPPRVLVFFDEAYFEYVQSADYPDTLALQKKYSNVLTTRTFSKMYALAGLRVGYGIGHPEVIDALNRLREPFNVNSLAQAAAVACLKDMGFYRRTAKLFTEEREYLFQSLRQMRLAFVPSVTNFILIKVAGDSSRVAGRLLRQGVIVRDMKSWGLKKYIRVTIGTHAENQKFIQELGEIL